VKAKPFIVGFLAVVAVIAAVSIYFSATVDKAVKSVSVVVSPDGKYKAVKVTLASGGASPFCFDSIAVVFAAYPDSFAERDKAYEVYSGPCGRFATGEPVPKIEWLSNTALQISYAAVPNTKAPRTKNIDVTKTVHITFSSLR
jgi:hypothetical protein